MFTTTWNVQDRDALLAQLQRFHWGFEWSDGGLRNFEQGCRDRDALCRALLTAPAWAREMANEVAVVRDPSNRRFWRVEAEGHVVNDVFVATRPERVVFVGKRPEDAIDDGFVCRDCREALVHDEDDLCPSCAAGAAESLEQDR